MKKLFLLTSVLFFYSFGFAQFADNFDSYIAGQKVACQNPTDWTTWSNAPCGAEDAEVSATYSMSTPNSVKILPGNDLVKPIANLTTGFYSIKFWHYIPTGKTGYFNVLHLFNGASSQWGFQAYFHAGGAGSCDAGSSTPYTFTWIADQWIPVELKVNLDADQAEFLYNNVSIVTYIWHTGTFGSGTLNQLGGVNLYGELATNEMYVDNFGYDIVPVELTSFTAIDNHGSVSLNWSTATEINNRGFEVERKDANGQYITLGFVNGNGTTSNPQAYTFIDKNVPQGTYTYRLKQIDFNGAYEYFESAEVIVTAPLTFALNQNYPNPFNPSTKISYSVAEAGNVRLAVYNTLGQEIAVLVNSYQEANQYEVNFDAANLPTGAYFMRIETASFTDTKKMMLSK